MFGALHTLSPLFGVLQQPERAAGSKLMADRMCDVHRYKRYPVTEMSHRRSTPRRQIRCH
jgi:hypothetical protein